jgi:hypothetical protein
VVLLYVYRRNLWFLESFSLGVYCYRAINWKDGRIYWVEPQFQKWDKKNKFKSSGDLVEGVWEKVAIYILGVFLFWGLSK